MRGGGDGGDGTVFANEDDATPSGPSGKRRVTTHSWRTVSATMTHCDWSFGGIPCTEPDTTPTADGNIRLEWRSCEDGHRVVHYGFVGVEHGLPPDLEGGLLDLVIDFFETASHSAG